MTIRTLTVCLAAVLVSNSAAQAPQEKGRETSLEQPPEFTGERGSDSSRETNAEALEGRPLPPEETGNDEELEPTVTIKERGEVTVYEYRLNGLLYAVRVVPNNAPPYYLVDTDGDGLMDWRRNDLASPEINRIPAWVLFRW